jgi:branched-chain amino acid transport system substrate-binding protein
VYLAEVKSPDESEGEWDYYKILRTISGDQAFMSLEQSGCKLGS